MPDEATTAPANATADTGTEAPNPLSDDATAKDTQTTNQDERTLKQSEVNRIVARESAKAVKAALEARDAESQQAEMTEAQKEKARADALEAQVREAENRAQQIIIRNAVTLAVSDPRLQARDPQTLADLLMKDTGEFVVEGDRVIGIDDALKRIRAERPLQFYSSTADGGARSTGTVEMGAGLETLKNAYANSSRR